MGVAVGTAIAPLPPYRSVRAELPHTAPASGHDARVSQGSEMNFLLIVNGKGESMQASEKKKMLQGKLVGNIAILAAMTIALVAPAGAQTWKPQGKSAAITLLRDKVGAPAYVKNKLVCQLSSIDSTYMLVYGLTSYDPGGPYHIMYTAESSYIRFNPNGAYESANNGSDCTTNAWSLQQLGTMERAFD